MQIVSFQSFIVVLDILIRNLLPLLDQQEVPDNEFEKRIRPEVIPASEINVTFADVGALDDIKESLQELLCCHCEGLIFFMVVF